MKCAPTDRRYELRTLENCCNPAAFDPLATSQFTEQDSG